MAIPASHIVTVNPRVITAGSEDLEMNGLLLSDSDLIPALEVLSFGTAAAVKTYFGDGSPEDGAASVFFAGYDNKFTSPRVFFVTRRIKGAVGAWARGGRLDKSLADLRGITDGTFSVTFGGIDQEAEELDFSEATSFSEVAAILQAALTGVTVNYSSLTGAFQVTDANTGLASTIAFPSGTVAEALNLLEDSGAVLSQGSVALSESAQMDSALGKTENWVTFTTAWEASDEELLAFARWANSNYGYLYVAYTTDASTTVQTTSTDPASLLKENSLDHVAIIYGDLRHAVFIQGAIASIPWLRVNGTITLAFKRQSGLDAYVTEKAKAEVLESKNCNYYGNFATRNAEFRFLYPGILSSSDYRYIDSYVNSIWLNAMIQRSLMDGLARNGRVPYTQRGYNMIRAWFMDPVNQAVNNGAIEKGVALSQAQINELLTEAGVDISSELANYGYYLQVLDPGASGRYYRESPITNLWYTYAGSVQKLDVASTAVL